MKNKTLLTAMLVMMMAVFSTTSFAKGRGGRGCGRGEFGPKMMERLGLDDQQRAAIEKLRVEMTTDLKELREQMDQIRSKLHEQWSLAEPDAATIEALQLELDPIRSELRARRTEFKLATIAVLNDQQKELLAQHRKDRKSKRFRGKGKRGGGKGQGKGGNW